MENMNKIETISPIRIMTEHGVQNADKLIGNRTIQVVFLRSPKTILKKGGYIVLDYGKEIQGGVKVLSGEIVDEKGKLAEAEIRFRFGESVMESCAELGENEAGNYHSMRDFKAAVTTHGGELHGETGFRFVRLDNLSEYDVPLYSVNAVNSRFGGEQKGTFECDDPLLNKIFDTAVYTLSLCIQNGYIWDGIKRDRAVWIGDMHPEVLSAFLVYGNIEETRASINFCRDTTPENKWINSIPSYSFWWMWVMFDYVKNTGDKAYAEENRGVILHIFEQIKECFGEDGTWDVRKGKAKYFEGNEYFFDWPTNFTPDSEYGVRALMCVALNKIKLLYDRDEEINKDCDEFLRRLALKNEYNGGYKQVTAMRVLAGYESGADALDKLAKNNSSGMGCFMAYYILSAVAASGDPDKAVEMMKEYYGGMLKMGATTFWEDFDIEWTHDSCGVDEFAGKGQKNIHADFGKFCYTKFRHSLCHGWSTGAIPFIYQWLVGVDPEDLSNKKMRVRPHLCGLKHIKASIPTPYGTVELEHNAGSDGKVYTTYTAPSEIEIVVE